MPPNDEPSAAPEKVARTRLNGKDGMLPPSAKIGPAKGVGCMALFGGVLLLQFLMVCGNITVLSIKLSIPILANSLTINISLAISATL